MHSSTRASLRSYSSKTRLHNNRVSVESIKNRINHNSRETGGVTPHLEIVYRPAVPGIKWCRCHSIRSEETPPDPLSLLLWRGKLLQTDRFHPTTVGWSAKTIRVPPVCPEIDLRQA